MGFIPVDKMKQLREAAKNGDERAKKILRAQLDKKDYSADLDAYFAMPATETQSVDTQIQVAQPTKSTGNLKLDAFLADNGVQEGSPDYEDAVNDYYNEFPEERPEDFGAEEPQTEVQEELDMTKDMAQGIIDLISKCDQTSLQIMQNESLDDTARKGAMVSLQEIKQSLFDSADKLKKIKQSFDKKQEIPLN